MGGLFDDESTEHSNKQGTSAYAPLAEQLRPLTWKDFQADGSIDLTLLNQLRSGKGRPPSLVLWGPPGTGKTSFAKLIGKTFQLPFVEFSAVLGGVHEVRTIVTQARQRKQTTLLFVDEIHRFNKAQQDAFLPHVEAGVITLIGATTENPSFALNNSLLSRLRLVVFSPLSPLALRAVLQRALLKLRINLDDEAAEKLIHLASGDARQLLNWLESLHQSLGIQSDPIGANEIDKYLRNARATRYDKSGDEHYDTVSAFIKSLRGSDPDAALFYGFRMIEAGDDPRYLLRRMLVFASEDIGNANPQALTFAVAAADAFERLGMPEGKIILAQCITYLACSPKSNRSYLAMQEAINAVKQHPEITIPLHLRNAPTKMMKELGYAQNYQYSHEDKSGYIPGIRYLPEEVGTEGFYKPSPHGQERTLLDWRTTPE
ncbi:MAG TPA: replication-associated recombination protein A [Gemmatales bacterium]|nr:replication-associated recombination protein A [Gemmatales bacterium]HMP15525.1 replication-associated recombination protein A [Gemmatales bacterium]